jgi:membrane protein YdbS with pleckstrin-like domain
MGGASKQVRPWPDSWSQTRCEPEEMDKMAPVRDPTLQAGEKLLVQIRLSWLFIFRSLGTFLGAIFSLGLAPYLARRASLLTVTSRRLILRRGVLDRSVIEMELGRVAQVEVSSGVLDRLCGVGRLKIIALDQFDMAMSPVSDPDGFKDLIMEAVAEAKRALGSTVPTAQATPGDRSHALLAALEKLGQLRASGVLSESEFQVKKSELLSRL